jgi:Spy/CpxP family protein refolding chaperone
MEATNRRTSWEVRLAAVVIFVLGFLAGALALNLYRGHRGFFPEGRGRMEDVLGKLNLSGDQKSKVEGIFNDARTQLKEIRKQDRPKMGEVRKQTRERLQEVLSPEQLQQFDQLMKERHGRHGRGFGNGEGEGEGDGGD